MRNRWIQIISTLTLAVLAMPAMAGGFGFTLSQVKEATDKAPKAVLLIEQGGCVPFSETTFTITLERMDGGKRQSIPLKYVKVEDEKFAIEQTWPAEAGWSLVVKATSQQMVFQAVAPLDSTGKPYAIRDAKTDKTKIAATYAPYGKPMTVADLEKLLTKRPAAVASKSNE